MDDDNRVLHKIFIYQSHKLLPTKQGNAIFSLKKCPEKSNKLGF